MSYWSRVRNVFRSERLNREIDEEMQCHIEEAIEAGRDPEEARRSFGRALQQRERSRDVKVAAWLDGIRADFVFGWRQLIKSKTSSGAAALSLALTIGACTAAFRLADAVLFRPLPVAEPGRLFFLEYEFRNDRSGEKETGDTFEYPLFRHLRASLKDDAELMAISYTSPIDLTYGSDQEMEKVYRQYCSGWMFGTFGLKPAIGRLLTSADDVKPGASAVAVLSYDYWTRRFGRDPKAVGKKFREGNSVYEIVGVVHEGFPGTEPGKLTDVFVPTMMNAKAIDQPNWGWFRTWARVRPASTEALVRQKLQAAFSAYRREHVKTWPSYTPKDRVEEYVNAPLLLQSASAGVSGMQKQLRRPLAILGAVIALVLLIACANVANLMSAQAHARAREMALRVSIGAGRARLAQMVLAESALLAVAASLAGAVFAWWSVPLVVGMLSTQDNPVRLILPFDWRVLGFAMLVAALVTFLFGLIPALRASSVKPMSALRGGESPHSKRRLMLALVAAQVAFCFLVHFAAGLFVTTFQRLSKQPTGFSADRVLTLETLAKDDEPAAKWEQVLNHVRSIEGVESAALCSWALMSGNGWSSDIWVDGHTPNGNSPYFLGVSPEWLQTMRIPLIDGRDFRPDDAAPRVALVNEAFARQYFGGANPIGRSFEQREKDKTTRTTIVGYVRDARYREMREPIRPTVYLPFQTLSEKGEGLRPANWATVVVRTENANPVLMAPLLRQEVPRARSEFRVSNIRTQQELVSQHTIQERVLATMSVFFATLALVLAGVGLYGVLYFSIVQRRREIGIRIALGARNHHIARQVTADVLTMLAIGSVTGLAVGLLSERLLRTLLYEVKATEPVVIGIPAAMILGMGLLATIPPVVRALGIDAAETLRAE